MLAEFAEDELGVRPEGRRPAFWWKHGVVRSVLGNQIKQRPTGDQRQQHCIHEDLDDVLLCRIELIEFVPRLQFTKEQLNLPAAAVDRCEITREKLASRQVRDVEMIVVGVLVADADDAESLTYPTTVCPRTHAAGTTLPPQRRYTDGAGPQQRPESVCLPGEWRPTPFPQFGRYNRIRTVFQTTHEVAAVLIDQREPPVLEVR